ncbi:MAG: LLM class flavin-dependent oxidoreductase [Actinomycetia bacterium]|nr:LLM class flavin-dependent oxidoreductase [Actinomycetes bacterium]
MELQFGLTLPQRGLDLGVFETAAEMVDLARAAEGEPRFDSVWVGDSLTAKPRLESLTLLGALAGATSRLRLGVGCMASFPVRDVLTFAYQWASLDVISGGRMDLAACTGLVPANKASAREGAHWGVLDKERAPRLEDNIRACRLLWSGDEVSFEGTHTSFDDFRLATVPLQDPCPVWIAANPFPGPFYERALRRVATLADGWQTVGLFPDMMGSSWSALKGYLDEAGRDIDAFPRMAYHNVNLNPDRSAALDESVRFIEAYYGKGSFTPAMVESWTAAGSVEQAAADLRAVAASGATAVTLRMTSWDQQGQYERLVSELLPALAGLEVA